MPEVPSACPARPDVQDALAAIEGLDALPVSEHVEVYDAVHRALQDALADLDGA